ncbi:hypothetical protein V6N13_079491 [Hibiscus sabdariffa]
MAASLSVLSPPPPTKEHTTSMASSSSSSPLFSPASEKRFWSTLRGRVDDRNASFLYVFHLFEADLPRYENCALMFSFWLQNSRGESNRAKRLKEDSLLLLRGFDSISQTLSQLSNNLDNALQGARELAKPPTLTDIFHSNLKNSEPKEGLEVEEESRIGLKRKFDHSECSDDNDSHKESKQSPRNNNKMMKKAKNLAISMATKAASLARELKSIKNDLCFMQERCGLLEEENRRLRDGFTKGIRPEEDDLVRLQLEALLAEKSRLANENANLVRENQCLHQLVEYHQMTSQDLSASYEQVLRGMCLDFSSPIAEEEQINGGGDADKSFTPTPRTNILGLSTSLDEYFDEELEQQARASPSAALFHFSPSPPFFSRFTKSPFRRFLPQSKSSLPNNSFSLTSQQLGPQGPQNQQPPRTLFPGGYKRPEIKVPNFVLQLDPDEVLGDDNALDFIDKAVSKWVGLVVLNGGEGSGGTVYEAARSLKAVVKDRAYLLITERVDIAAAVGASGVVLSDQGLPAIVARNTMMDSKSDSVFLPLVARIVQSSDAALNASGSEGADFLIYDVGQEEHVDMRCHRMPSCPTFSNQDESFNELKMADIVHDSHQKTGVAGFVNMEDREKQLIEKERSVLTEAINVFQKAAPLMEEISLLIDAVAQIDEPFLLAIVGEFNSGKSTVINALLGERYLTEGVIPTTNEITFLRYSELDGKDLQRCERHPDGQLICYLPAPILKEVNIVDTPGTNVILQRQQRLTEEFVPRADLLFFVISADRPLTESEVTFLRYTQQWKKKVVFVLNKADLYQNVQELDEAISFIKENTQKLLNTEDVTLYPVAARSVLEEKLSATSGVRKKYGEPAVTDSNWRTSSFYKLEDFLYSFLDGSTSRGMERMKLKLGTPIAIAEQILSACETLNRKDCESAEQDLTSANEIVNSVKEYAIKMEDESISWRRRTLSMIDTTKSRILELIESTLQLSNLDVVASYLLKGESSTTSLPATSRVRNDILGPALADAQNLLGDYVTWLQSNNAREGRLYKESFEKRWPSVTFSDKHYPLETYELLRNLDELSLRVIDNFSANTASKLFEHEIREAFLGTFGGLGAAGLSASLLTSILPTTLEDLLALGLCSAGGFIAISNFPARRQKIIEKVKKTADALGRELEDAMQKDLQETTENLENFVRIIGEPYRDAARNRLNKLLEVKDELSNAREGLKMLQVEIQNLHVS